MAGVRVPEGVRKRLAKPIEREYEAKLKALREDYEAKLAKLRSSYPGKSRGASPRPWWAAER